MKNTSIFQEEKRLKKIIEKLGSAIIAFSGGVDSSYLLYTAHQVLGDKVLAVTAESPTYPAFEIEEAKQFCRKYGIPHMLISSKELSNPKFCRNSTNRCYFCKLELFQQLWQIANDKSFKQVLDGSNVDDLADHRPGRKAGQKLGVISPLIEAGLGKEKIRELSRKAGLASWDKPTFACFASRIPYDSPITIEKLKMIEQAEEVVRLQGFKQFRVRMHNNLARLEISPAEMPRALSLEFANLITKEFKRIGFIYVTLDLQGYRSGSMNEVLTEK